MSSLPIRTRPLLAARWCSAGLAAAVVSVGAAGCASHSSGQAYPTPPSSTIMPNAPASSTGNAMTPAAPAPAPTPMPAPMPPTMASKTLMVPAGARVLAAGPLPLPAFYAPPEGGTLYIYDIDAAAVEKITSYGTMSTPGGESKPLNLADLPNATNNLDPTHKYRVYYVPSAKTTSLPTTLPSP